MARQLAYSKSFRDRLSAFERLLPAALRGPARALYKRIGPQRAFSLDAAIKWLCTLKEHGIAFGFPDDLADWNAARPLAILKHDIHDNLDRAVDMARAEHEQSIVGLYFMMGPHALNKSFYGSRRSWDQLRTIQELGHRIGLHLDTFDALRRGGVYEFVGSTLADFSREGLSVRYANSHGDRRYEMRGGRPADVFTEYAALRRKAPERIDSEIALHLRKYSLKHLAEHFGLTYWVDSRVLREGVPMQPTLYVSDNKGCIRIGARDLSSKPFEVDAEFVDASVRILATTQSLILLHPQWYTSRSR